MRPSLKWNTITFRGIKNVMDNNLNSCIIEIDAALFRINI